MEPTTVEHVLRAQSAYDEAAAQAARLSRDVSAALEQVRSLDALVARAAVAVAEREYAWGVYVSATRDHLAAVERRSA